jgi:hypothetical protein
VRAVAVRARVRRDRIVVVVVEGILKVWGEWSMWLRRWFSECIGDSLVAVEMERNIYMFLRVYKLNDSKLVPNKQTGKHPYLYHPFHPPRAWFPFHRRGKLG